MPRFFFNSRVGGSIATDPEGTEAPDIEAAKAMAIKSAREILADNIKSGATTRMEAIIVTDESGKELLTIRAKDILPEPLK